MKNLNITITEEAHEKLKKLIIEKGFKNRADAVDWIIQITFDLVFGKRGAQNI